MIIRKMLLKLKKNFNGVKVKMTQIMKRKSAKSHRLHKKLKSINKPIVRVWSKRMIKVNLVVMPAQWEINQRREKRKD